MAKAHAVIGPRGLCGFLLLALFPAFPAAAQNRGQDRDEIRREEQEDYFQKWLDEDVVYIITEEERQVFEKLTTPEEKERFIEQFWTRRDPDPRTAVNEFKEEHYRRIAYANGHFFWSKPGWMTDRGRIYIIHGPPDEIESHPAGGPYDRPIWEGGGTTVTYPFEVWRYRYLEGIGSDVVLEFVDPSLTREYRLALRPEEKDALLTTPGVGLTLAEESGETERKERPFFSHDARINQGYPGMFQRAQDSPFERYRRFVNVQRPPQIKYRDLKELVEIQLSYENLPFQVQTDHLRLSEDQVLVPVTLQVANRELSFQEEGGRYVARLAIYGLVTTLTNQIASEFEDEVRTSFPSAELEPGMQRFSIYQKLLVLERKTRYKLDLVVKDLGSGKIGTVRRAIPLPPSSGERLSRSSLILSDYIRSLGRAAEEDEMFVLGNVRVRPNLNREFSKSGPLGVYLQVYNVAVDQSTLAPSLRIRYQIFRGSEKVLEFVDENGESAQFHSAQRLVLIRQLPLHTLEAGEYRLVVEVEDLLSRQQISAEERFRVVEPARQLAAGSH